MAEEEIHDPTKPAIDKKKADTDKHVEEAVEQTLPKKEGAKGNNAYQIALEMMESLLATMDRLDDATTKLIKAIVKRASHETTDTETYKGLKKQRNDGYDKQINQRKASIKKLDDHIDKTKNSLNDLPEEDRAKALESISKAEALKDKFQKEINEFEADKGKDLGITGALDAAIERSKDKTIASNLEQIESKIEETAQKIKTTEENITQTKTDIEKTETEIKQTEQDVAQSQTEIAQTKADLRQTETDIAQAQESIEQSESLIRQTSLDIENAQKEINQSQENIKQIEQEIQDLGPQDSEKNTDLLESKQEALETQKANLNAQNEQLQTLNDTLQNQNEILETQKAELEVHTAERNDQNAQLESQNTRLQEQNDTLQTQTATLETQTAELNTQTASLDAQKDEKSMLEGKADDWRADHTTMQTSKEEPDEPKPDEPKPDEPKPDEPKPDELKPDELKPDEQQDLQVDEQEQDVEEELRNDEPELQDDEPENELPEQPDQQDEVINEALSEEVGIPAKEQPAENAGPKLDSAEKNSAPISLESQPNAADTKQSQKDILAANSEMKEESEKGKGVSNDKEQEEQMKAAAKMASGMG